ncbi:MAG: CBS domain-containing protein, partial [Phaeodactylibacter sp.]|nr:CBS domain-containing protein [Phaeodactylibacter sp.]
MKDKTTTVGQIMSTPVITVSPDDTMSKVQDIFRMN